MLLGLTYQLIRLIADLALVRTLSNQPPQTHVRALPSPIFVQTSRRRTSDCSKRDRLRPQVLRQAVVDPGRALTHRLLARLLLPAADPSFECHGPARPINATHGLGALSGRV